MLDLVISISQLGIKLRTELSRTQGATMVIMKRVSELSLHIYEKFNRCIPSERERQAEWGA